MIWAPAQKNLDFCFIFYFRSQILSFPRIYTIFQETLPLLSNYRNPCWLERFRSIKNLYRRNQLVLSADARAEFQKTLEDGATVFKERFDSNGSAWRLRCIPYFYIIGEFLIIYL